ncbi:MAG: TIGR03960 family B12-binding radical SAM protein [Thermoanaerobaculaceae bacterium]|nr:TIGR03960 family B12-binding radical SAM protein [Thermoanaerobaculaceae bacterium]
MIKVEDYPFLLRVSKPTRYCGGEINEVIKEKKENLFNVAICFPEVYDIGMSNLGLQILYSVLNSKRNIWAQRCFMPFPDMEEELLKRRIPLYALESGMELSKFDLIGFSLQYELTYSNVLRMLFLAKIPLFSKERDELFPIVIAGGPSAVNPEPLSDFIDAFFLGDGEEGFAEICDVLEKEKSSKKEKKLEALASVEGVYIPQFYSVKNFKGKTVVDIPTNPKAPKIVKKRILVDLESFAMPSNPILPSHEIIHDRFAFEISRGCSFGCRFCEAGYIYRPLRHRTEKSIIEGLLGASKNLGYDEVSLLSLNSGEYPEISSLLDKVKDYAEEENIEISLPSLRVTSINSELLRSFERKKKMSFTIAPEAGSERLRRVINKSISDDEILKSAEILFNAGFSSIKLYFIIGLPTETVEYIKSITELAGKIVSIGKKMGVKRLNITVSTSSFVPKPFTPFQWEAVPKKEDIVAKQNFLKKTLKPPISYKWHDIDASLLEALFSRGDRRLNRVLYEAFLLGCKMDGWAEHFHFDLWVESFRRCGYDIFQILEEKFETEDHLPWDFIDIGVNKKYLKDEKEKALREEKTEACGSGLCYNCGSLSKICSQIEAPKSAFSFPKVSKPRENLIYAYRTTFKKEFPATLLGHLDFIKSLTRSFRRSGIDIIYSEGYHPFPKIEVASPLPLGVSGESELMDFYASTEIDENVLNSLQRNLLEGFKIKEIFRKTENEIPLNRFSIHNYEIDIKRLSQGQKTDVFKRLSDFIQKEEYLIETKKRGERKVVDLRKKVLDSFLANGEIRLKLLNGGITKIAELLFDEESLLIVKTVRKSLEQY